MELEEAYATLHNQRSREKYDKLGYDGEGATSSCSAAPTLLVVWSQAIEISCWAGRAVQGASAVWPRRDPPGQAFAIPCIRRRRHMAYVTAMIACDNAV